MCIQNRTAAAQGVLRFASSTQAPIQSMCCLEGRHAACVRALLALQGQCITTERNTRLLALYIDYRELWYWGWFWGCSSPLCRKIASPRPAEPII